MQFLHYDKALEAAKGWGKENWMWNGDYCFKVLTFKRGKQCSLHFHREKHETFFVLNGLFELVTINTATGEEEVSILKPGYFVVIDRCVPHQIKCSVAGRILEASTHHMDHDSYRVKPGDSQRLKNKKCDL